MALRGPLWLMSECLTEERDRGPLTHLAAIALDLGIRRTDRTRGHVFQASGAVQNFYLKHREHAATADDGSPIEAYDPTGAFLSDWTTWLGNQSGTYGHPHFGFEYDYDVLKGYLTSRYGGTRTGGGGGNHELKLCFRLVAHFQ